jgi:hypothetical protein
VADQPTEQRDWIAWFRGWFNSPATWEHDSSIVRFGASNAKLGIFPGGFSVFSSAFERRFHKWDRVDYQWPAVVLEGCRPVPQPSLLFDFKGEIAQCGLWHHRKQVQAALKMAGLDVIEVSVRGWNSPWRVPHELLGSDAERLPKSVVAYNEWAIDAGGWRRLDRLTGE